MDRSGEIMALHDQGTVWALYFRNDDGMGIVAFDWRQFADAYENESGRCIFHDYAFGQGRDTLEAYFKGRHIRVEGEPSEEL